MKNTELCTAMAALSQQYSPSLAAAPFADRFISADNCFTLLRYAFALAIFCNHMCYVSGRDIFLCYGGVFVQGFFVMSGFLTMNSYVRQDDWHDYALRRMRRILPGYISAVLICFVLGTIFTTLPLADFFSHADTWKYLVANLAFLNFLQPSLPGVFEDHALIVMNSSLWTMKIEVLFYVSVPFVVWMMKRWRPTWVLTIITLLSWIWFTVMEYLFKTTDKEIYYTLNHQIMGELQFFYFPVLLWWRRDWVRRHERVLCTVAVVQLVLSYSWWRDASLLNFYTLSVLILIVAYRLEPIVHARRWKDVSYEFFLLRFPLLQVCVELMPTVSLGVLAAVSLPILIVSSILLNVWCKIVSKSLKSR